MLTSPVVSHILAYVHVATSQISATNMHIANAIPRNGRRKKRVSDNSPVTNARGGETILFQIDTASVRYAVAAASLDASSSRFCFLETLFSFCEGGVRILSSTRVAIFDESFLGVVIFGIINSGPSSAEASLIDWDAAFSLLVIRRRGLEAGRMCGIWGLCDLVAYLPGGTLAFFAGGIGRSSPASLPEPFDGQGSSSKTCHEPPSWLRCDPEAMVVVQVLRCWTAKSRLDSQTMGLGSSKQAGRRSDLAGQDVYRERK
jgi:hypothetical protein